MLDTIAIKIAYPNFMVSDPNLFTPALIIQENQAGFNHQYGRHKFMKYQQNRTLADKKAGIYMPRLTVYQRFDGIKATYELHIDFSIPKLLLVFHKFVSAIL